jgi:hypothetical protein
MLLFLVVIALFTMTIPGIQRSPAHNEATVSANLEDPSDPQEGGGDGGGRDGRCKGIWVWFFGWYCYTP